MTVRFKVNIWFYFQDLSTRHTFLVLLIFLQADLNYKPISGSLSWSQYTIKIKSHMIMNISSENVQRLTTI